MPMIPLLSEAFRERRRDWRVTFGFCGVLGTALAVAVVCLSLAWPLIWEPLPYPNASRVWAIQSSRKGVPGGLPWRDADDLRERVPSIEKIAVYSARTWGVQTERHGHVEVLLSAMTTSEFFQVLGVRPALGGPFTSAHDTEGAQRESWLANAAAARLFGQAEASLNRTIWINAVPYHVAGVLPASFQFPMEQGSPDLIIPLSRSDYCCARGAGAQQAIALLRTSRNVDAELRLASNTLALDFPVTNADMRFVSVGLRDHLFGPRMLALRWMLAGAFCLVLVAAANGSGIWMARWLKTRRDMAVRLSLGAPAGRLAGVSAFGGALAGIGAGGTGFVLAAVLLRIMQATPFMRDHLDAFAVWRPLELAPVTVPGALIAGACVGLVAALLPHYAIMRRLRNTGTSHAMSAHPATRRLRLVFTAVQLTATAILCWTAIAIGENVHSLLTAPRGFETQDTLITNIGIPEGHYDTDEKMIAFHTAAIAELRTVPGVTAAAGGVDVPRGNARTRFLRDGQTLERDRQPTARIGIISPELLPMLQIALRAGRGFTGDDRWTAPRVALVNQAFVRTHLADAQDPLREGLRLSFYNGFAMKPYTRFQIVGVVADTRNDTLLVETQPQVLIPAAQIAMEGFSYYVKTTRPAASVEAELREAIWRVDPGIERVTFRPLLAYVDQRLADRQALTAFGLLVLVISATIVAAGLYASLSASLSESTRELAIRSAVGATPVHLAIESLRWALLAAALSGAVTALAVPLIASRVQLEKAVLRPTPMSVGLCLLTMALVVAAAAFRPVRQAASTAPVAVLRLQ